VKDKNFRLDRQGKTTAGEQNYQIQANKFADNKHVRRINSKSVATIHVGNNQDLTTEDVRNSFKKSYHKRGEPIKPIHKEQAKRKEK